MNQGDDHDREYALVTVTKTVIRDQGDGHDREYALVTVTKTVIREPGARGLRLFVVGPPPALRAVVYRCVRTLAKKKRCSQRASAGWGLASGLGSCWFFWGGACGNGRKKKEKEGKRRKKKGKRKVGSVPPSCSQEVARGGTQRFLGGDIGPGWFFVRVSRGGALFVVCVSCPWAGSRFPPPVLLSPLAFFPCAFSRSLCVFVCFSCSCSVCSTCALVTLWYNNLVVGWGDRLPPAWVSRSLGLSLWGCFVGLSSLLRFSLALSSSSSLSSSLSSVSSSGPASVVVLLPAASVGARFGLAALGARFGLVAVAFWSSSGVLVSLAESRSLACACPALAWVPSSSLSVVGVFAAVSCG